MSPVIVLAQPALVPRSFVYTPSAPIVVATNGRVIEGLSFTGPIDGTGAGGLGISAPGTVGTPIQGLTIRHCRFIGFEVAIQALFVNNLIVDNCLIEDANYAGVAGYSCIGGEINGNTIRRIGFIRTDFTGPDDVNAYGITLDTHGSGFIGGNPDSSDFTIDGNVIEDVPLWHGLNTHAGKRLIFTNNYVRRVARGAFITQNSAHVNPGDVTFTANHIEDARTKSGGSDSRGITIVGLVNGTFNGNYISSTYGGPIIDGVNIEEFIFPPDYPAPINVTYSGNVETA